MMQSKWGVWLRTMGLPGLLGVTFMALSMWVVLTWVPSQREQVERLASDVRHLRHDLQQKDAGDVHQPSADKPWDVSGLSPEAAWQSVWDVLPDESAGISLMKMVTASGEKIGVTVASVQYRGAPEKWSQHDGQYLWRQQMSMPIEGRYGDVRSWIGTFLHQSNLSLDAVEISRPDTTSDHVKGRVSLSIWWRTVKGAQS